jgi:hypothetical protein
MFEVDMEFWGLETAGRLVGRYVAIVRAAARYEAGRDLEADLAHLVGAFLYRFIRGEGEASPELVRGGVRVGLGGFHAALLSLYAAAVLPPAAPAFVRDALNTLRAPAGFLALAADYAGSRPVDEAGPVLETVEGVRTALRPLVELAAELLD